jgi:hypothetical protein
MGACITRQLLFCCYPREMSSVKIVNITNNCSYVRWIYLVLFTMFNSFMNLQVLSQLIALTLIVLSGPIVIGVLAFNKASYL